MVPAAKPVGLAVACTLKVHCAASTWRTAVRRGTRDGLRRAQEAYHGLLQRLQQQQLAPKNSPKKVVYLDCSVRQNHFITFVVVVVVVIASQQDSGSIPASISSGYERQIHNQWWHRQSLRMVQYTPHHNHYMLPTKQEAQAYTRFTL